MVKYKHIKTHGSVSAAKKQKIFKRGAYINIVEISRLYKYIWWDDTLSFGLETW